jgi:lysophospholipid acyltransferase (LPLAT)-like uncharacterized protein
MTTRGTIYYSEVAHKDRWYHRASAPLVAFCNLAVAAWLYPSLRASRINWNPDLESLLRVVRERSKPIIYYTWHEYELLAVCAFRNNPPNVRPMPIGHDGILSRILQNSTAWFGYSIWVYRRQSTVRPKDQLVDFLRSGPYVVGLFADSGGSDGIVRPSLPEVARRSGAMLIPFGISARPAVNLTWPKKFSFPLPFSSIEVFWGQPIDGSNASVEHYQKALESQVERASEGQE